MTTTESTAERTRTRFLDRRIPVRKGAREILKVNLYAFMVNANSTLIPLFPYHDAGSIVPCGSLFYGRADGKFGHFFHCNTVDEIVMCFGANNAMIKTGQVFVTQPLHGVNSFLRKPEDPDAFLVLTITQRQADEGEQTEAVLFRCAGCHTELYRRDYSATPSGHGDMLDGFITIADSMAAVEGIAEESARTCPKCGEVMEPFPMDPWGWHRWVNQLRTVNDARRALDSHKEQHANEPAAS